MLIKIHVYNGDHGVTLPKIPRLERIIAILGKKAKMLNLAYYVSIYLPSNSEKYSPALSSPPVGSLSMSPQ